MHKLLECTEVANFQNLHRLHSLRLAWQVLTRKRGHIPRALLRPVEVFPPNLRCLIVDNVSLQDLNEVCERIWTETGESGVADTTLWGSVVAVHSSFRLSRLESNVGMFGYTDPEPIRISATAVQLLRQVVDEMFNLGVEMTVQLMPACYQGEFRPMLRRVFIAESLQSSYLAEEEQRICS